MAPLHLVKVRPDVVWTPPTATRQGVVTVLLPLMLIALAEVELAAISQLGELKVAPPLKLSAALAVGSSARMQAGLDIVATERALTVGLLDRKRPARNRGCGC